MNKAELIEEIRNISGDDCSKACAERALNSVLEAVMNGIKNSGSVQIIGFGTFSVGERAARIGVNPKTKEKIKIAASKSIKFKAGAKFKDVL